MVIVAAWSVFALGVLHLLMGLLRFKTSFSEVLAEGFFGKFQGVDRRRLAFWFTVVGPLMMLIGHIAVHAANEADFALVRIIGLYMLAVSIVGLCAFPKSPFWAALILAPILIAGGCGIIT